MKAGENAVLTFSCVAKKHVPEGTTAIEAEMQQVGFADTTEKKSDFYWRNKDLTLDARKKAKQRRADDPRHDPLAPLVDLGLEGTLGQHVMLEHERTGQRTARERSDGTIGSPTSITGRRSTACTGDGA